MKIFKRGLISILRTPLKTLILLLIVLIIGTTISGTISTFQAITHTDKVALQIEYTKNSIL